MTLKSIKPNSMNERGMIWKREFYRTLQANFGWKRRKLSTTGMTFFTPTGASAESPTGYVPEKKGNAPAGFGENIRIVNAGEL